MHRSWRPAATVLALLAVLSPVSARASATPTATRTGRLAASGALLPLTTSEDLRIVDSAGRDVILRGANVNSLGEYWQGDPSTAPTVPVGEADWAEMEARGLNVVRLLITWSRVEPTRGTIDETYLDEIEAQVELAAAHGIYTVIDMHQDAYSATIVTEAPEVCSAGTTPHKGWDGAPAWATLTDGLPTCDGPSGRNDSPAVLAAWNHFYDDTDGIATEFVKAWTAIAARFAGRPEVAGYDLLNEPEASRPSAELTPIYNQLMRRIILAIRAAESSTDFEHLVFIEPPLPTADASFGLVIPDPKAAGVDPKGIVASVHNYAESIGTPGLDFTIEGLNELVLTLTRGLGVASWGGEYGFWDTAPSTLDKLDRFAADEDKYALGNAWWQWRQSCGDPHSIGWDGADPIPAGDQTHLHKLGCPGNVDLGPTEEFFRVLGRAYPRATPGRVSTLRSDWRTGVFQLDARTQVAGGQLVVWSPTADDADHRVSVLGLTDVQQQVVGDGRIITATVTAPGDYSLRIGEPALEAAPTDTTPPATPIEGPATFTG